MRVRLDLSRGMPSLLIVGNVVDRRRGPSRLGGAARRTDRRRRRGSGSRRIRRSRRAGGSADRARVRRRACPRRRRRPGGRRRPRSGRRSGAAGGPISCLAWHDLLGGDDGLGYRRPRLRATAAGVRIAMGAGARDGAVVAGVHLEGPWLAPTPSRRPRSGDAAAARPGRAAGADRCRRRRGAPVDARAGARRRPRGDRRGYRAPGSWFRSVTPTPPTRRPAPRSTPALVI